MNVPAKEYNCIDDTTGICSIIINHFFIRYSDQFIHGLNNGNNDESTCIMILQSLYIITITILLQNIIRFRCYLFQYSLYTVVYLIYEIRKLFY